ncbi:MAG: class I mannose-6-phosphate isomerase [Planctomycetia bacterium]|nr:class I mannose-6-phosphate isomerase [Planctomycetia bacterium]
MLYPLRFLPIYKSAIWGGENLSKHFGRALPQATHMAESWEVSGHPDGISVVANGPLTGMPMTELMARYRQELLGTHASSSRFPLLVKFLDAQHQLSVQVHPNRQYVEENAFDDFEKAEAWVVLRVNPGSRLTLGFKEHTSRETIHDALKENRLEDLLATVEPQPGECYFLPPGTVHSLGAGILLYEVQQCSNLTFRLYDWNRPDENGQLRPLHITHGLRALNPEHWNTTPISPRPGNAPGHEILLETPYFHLARQTFSPRASHFTTGGDGRCHVLTLLEGTVSIPGLETPMQKGDTVVLPAVLSATTLSCVEHAVLLDASNE